MVKQTETPLIVYKASAGSGKTFTLAAEYIKLVMRNPQAYRHILAVTFTNKAAEEMKMRILSQLYGIWHQLDSSKSYLEEVCKQSGVSPEFASQQAGIALNYLLHDYSHFRVGTIDSFFQTVLRNLARELDLTANMRIGLNDYQVEEQAVDELIEELSVNDFMLKWILKYIMESISNDRSWNIIGQIKQFGKTIFKDYYKAESEELNKVIDEPEFYESYINGLQKIRNEAKEQMKGIADSFFAALTEAGFNIDDLAYGKNGIAGMFQKMQNGVFDESIAGKRITDSIDAPEKWYKKDHERKEELHMLATGALGDILKRALNERPKQWRKYKSAELTLQHLNQLRLLECIERKVRALNESANLFLLSDTQQLLQALISGNDSPFIFEKIGTQLEHIMIDEFQDTSTVQWKNFKVLLEETMSHAGTENLIVGDVKQSIYRWRSGDWRLLNNITNEFPDAERQVSVLPLDTNYRSNKNIVDFNNIFFSQAAKNESISAYSDVTQKVPKNKPQTGYVSITLLPSDGYQEQVLRMITEEVGRLIRNQVPMSKIAILVRVNSQIPLIANYFMENLPEIPIVSDEAFRLDASPAIQVIIQSLSYLVHPNDEIAKAYLAITYTKKPLHEGVIDDMLPEDFKHHREELLRLPLYELIEKIYSFFHLNEMEGQSAYLCAFYDQVVNYVNEQTTDIAEFLTDWNDSICAKTIQIPDMNGVRIISIHKSKGLEFPHVLVPFCDWKMEHNDIIWCKPKEAPFNRLPIVPINYSQKGMSGTIYEEDYKTEHQQNDVDNMNLLYVAFTRASESLYVIGKRNSKGCRSTLIEEIIAKVTEELEGASLEGMKDEKAPIHFEYGIPATASSEQTGKKDVAKEKNIFLQESIPVDLTLEVFNPKVEFKQSNDSRNFAQSQDGEEREQAYYIQLGSVLHNVFSNIRTTKDVDKALQSLEQEGIIYDRQLSREHIETMIRKRFEHPQVADWYSPRWTLFNECTILNVDKNDGTVYERRPDRVMTDGKEMIVVDFKFGRPKEEYAQQVREYMNLLSDMGHRNIKGYLWYVYSNKIESVK